MREDIEGAARDAALWGFPRPILEYEKDRATWFRMAPGVVFWVEAFEGVGIVFPHLAVSEERRGHWPVRSWLRFMNEFAASKGADQIGFVDGPEYAEAFEYLSRLGWSHTEFGLVSRVGAY